MTTIGELGRRLDRVEAEPALHRLAHRFCIGADHRDLEVWRSVWTPDAIWDTGDLAPLAYSSGHPTKADG